MAMGLGALPIEEAFVLPAAIGVFQHNIHTLSLSLSFRLPNSAFLARLDGCSMVGVTHKFTLVYAHVPLYCPPSCGGGREISRCGSLLQIRNHESRFLLPVSEGEKLRVIKLFL